MEAAPLLKNGWIAFKYVLVALNFDLKSICKVLTEINRSYWSALLTFFKSFFFYKVNFKSLKWQLTYSNVLYSSSGMNTNTTDFEFKRQTNKKDNNNTTQRFKKINDQWDTIGNKAKK